GVTYWGRERGEVALAGLLADEFVAGRQVRRVLCRAEIDLATASGRRGQVGGGGRGRRRLGGGAGGIGVGAQAAGSAGLDPIGIALGGRSEERRVGSEGRGPDLGEVAAAGLLAVFDGVAGTGA